MPGHDYYVCDCGRGFYRSEGHTCDAQEKALESLERMLTPVKTHSEREQYGVNWDAVFGEGRDE